MLWKKTWEPEAVLALLGGIVASFFFGSVAVGLLQHAGVAGFKSDASVGSVLLMTWSFHGAALVLGAAFLKFHETSWREVFGPTRWTRCLGLACVALLIAAPIMFGLKYVSLLALDRLHLDTEDQRAVQLILGAKLWVRVYLSVWAVVIAPLAEEFMFRGLLFSLAKRLGWPKVGWYGVSFLFALFHLNAPTFLPLFALALALTWLCEKTDGLLAPVIAHSLFNAVNLVALLLADKYHYLNP
jgi:membrane protease YdiL (CAAX protease family)